MKVRAIVESLDDVPEALREKAVEKDGIYEFEVENPEAFYGAGAKNKADQLLKEKKALAARLQKLAAFEGLEVEDLENLTSEQVKEALALLKDHKPNAKDSEAVDALLKKRDGEWKAKLDTAEARATAAEKELRKYKLDLVVKDAALKAGLRPERVDYAMRINSHRFDLDENGKPVVLDEDGDPVSISLDTFWTSDWKTGNEDFYVGHNAGGSGASGSGKGPRGVDLSKLPPAERLKAARRQSAT